MLIIGSLRGHSIVVRLTIHALSEATIALLLTVTSELVHVVSIVRAAIIRVVVRIAAVLTLL